jgi:hypothetical protein
VFRHETTTHLYGNVDGINARIWAAAIRMKWMKLKREGPNFNVFYAA